MAVSTHPSAPGRRGFLSGGGRPFGSRASVLFDSAGAFASVMTAGLPYIEVRFNGRVTPSAGRARRQKERTR